MDVTVGEVVSLLTNVGFPAALCVILLRYVLETVGEKLDRLERALNKLNRTAKAVSVNKQEGDNERLKE